MFARLVARVRLPAQAAGLVLLAAGLLLPRVADPPRAVAPGLLIAGVVLVGVALAGTFLGPPLAGTALELDSPVQGRWEAVNSPTTRTPSHGTHAYGQTWAVDLVHAPAGIERPRFGAAGLGFLPPTAFPGFGRPVLAPAGGTVVRAVDRMRDHRSRSSWVALAWFVAEGLPRELLGPTGVLGNHVVLRLADGSCFVLAHLRRGSVTVRRGDRVVVRERVASCGNSGNTTEPHLHCHRQDVPSTFVAGGLPWTLRGTGIPQNGDVLDA